MKDIVDKAKTLTRRCLAHEPFSKGMHIAGDVSQTVSETTIYAVVVAIGRARFPVLIGENGYWYLSARCKKHSAYHRLIKRTCLDLPNVQRMSARDMVTIYTHGITGVVLNLGDIGERERLHVEKREFTRSVIDSNFKTLV